MPAVTALRERLADQVPGLRAVLGALDLAALRDRGGMAQAQTPAAFVVPRGLSGGAAQAAAGAFVQAVTETVGVLLLWRHTDRRDGGRLDEIEDLAAQVIAAVAGWGPADAVGVFRLGRGQEIDVGPGAFAWAIDFVIEDQMRITA